MAEPLLKARDVAQYLGLEMATVLDHFQAGDLPGFRLYGRKGGPVRFRLSEIEAWLEDACRVGHTARDNANGPAARERPGPGNGNEASDARAILRLATTEIVGARGPEHFDGLAEHCAENRDPHGVAIYTRAAELARERLARERRPTRDP